MLVMQDGSATDFDTRDKFLKNCKAAKKNQSKRTS
jgi:ABC-type protease/lipase transport system fused ATPase/permease subunit